MRTVFFGTPAIAVPALHALNEISEVAGVVCQPDRPSGRGLRLQAPPVKQVAHALGLVVHQPQKVKTGLDEWVRELNVDVALVMAYGRILPKSVLDAPRCGCINLHASLLPKYRGAAPINWCLIHGEKQSGISLMQMDEGMDTGPVYTARVLDIGAETTAGELGERLAEVAAAVVRDDLVRVVDGQLRPVPQDEAGATYAPPIKREDTLLNWDRPAATIVNLVRGMSPRPGAHTTLRGGVLKVHRLREPAAPWVEAEPGHIVITPDRRVLVGCHSGAVELLEAQPEGRKNQNARDLVNGRVIKAGDVLGQ